MRNRNDTWMYQTGVLSWAKRHISAAKFSDTTTLRTEDKATTTWIWWPTVLYPRWQAAAMSGLMVPLQEFERIESEQEAMTNPTGPRIKVALVENRPYVTQLVHNLVPKKASIGKRNQFNLRDNVVGHYLGLHRTCHLHSNEAAWACIPVEFVQTYKEYADVRLKELMTNLEALESDDEQSQFSNVRELEYRLDLAMALREAYYLTDCDPDLLPATLVKEAGIKLEAMITPTKKLLKSKMKNNSKSKSKMNSSESKTRSDSDNEDSDKENIEWFDEMDSQSETQTQTQTQTLSNIEVEPEENETDDMDTEYQPFTQEPVEDPNDVLTVVSNTSGYNNAKEGKKVSFADDSRSINIFTQ